MPVTHEAAGSSPVVPAIPMRYFATVTLAILTALGTARGQSASPSRSKEADRLESAARVFREITQAPDKTVPRDLLDRAECVIVIPEMIKGGFIIGGRYGKGAVSCRTQQGAGPWGPPCMVLLAGGSFGLQIGGAAVDVLMLVMNPSGIDRLLRDQMTLGGDVSAAAGPVGRAATAETDAQMNAKILTYSRSQGLFAGLELKGAVLKQDRKGNRNLYGRKVDARDLLIDAKASVPEAARGFIEQLTQVSPNRAKKPL